MRLLEPDRHHDVERAVFGCSGRTLDAFEGIVGMSLTGAGPYAGHDCTPYVCDGDGYQELTADEQIELADHMIAVWQKFKEERRGEERGENS